MFNDLASSDKNQVSYLFEGRNVSIYANTLYKDIIRSKENEINKRSNDEVSFIIHSQFSCFWIVNLNSPGAQIHASDIGS